MVDLKDFINESLLSGFDDIEKKQDEILFNPLKYLYNESLKCRTWIQLKKVILEFQDMICMKVNGHELKPKLPRPQTGVYSIYWSTKADYRFGKDNLLCFIPKIDNVSNRANGPVFMIGYSKSNYLRLEINPFNKITWKIESSNDITELLVRNEDHMYLVNPKSSIKDDYDEIFNEISK